MTETGPPLKKKTPKRKRWFEPSSKVSIYHRQQLYSKGMILVATNPAKNKSGGRYTSRIRGDFFPLLMTHYSHCSNRDGLHIRFEGCLLMSTHTEAAHTPTRIRVVEFSTNQKKSSATCESSRRTRQSLRVVSEGISSLKKNIFKSQRPRFISIFSAH